MALHDLGGSITIDEGAANNDIQKEEQAIEILSEAVSALDNLIAQTESMKGMTPAAIHGKAAEMKSLANQLIDNLRRAQNYTRKVVKDYQEIDKQWAAIMAADNAAKAAIRM